MELTTTEKAEWLQLGRDTSPYAFASDLLDDSPVATLLLDADFRVIWVNRNLERFLGLSRSELLGKDKRELIRHRFRGVFEDPETLAEKVLATYDDKARVLACECHVLPEGRRKERWLLCWSISILGGKFAGGRVEHFIDITMCKRLQSQLLQETERLSERVKELKALLEISRIAASQAFSFEEALQAVVDRIPPAWQFPHLTCARLTLGERQVQTENFREAFWRQSERVSVNGKRLGTLETFYLGRRRGGAESPFLKEEQDLLRGIAQMLAFLAERSEAERAARAREVELASQAANLEEVNTALRVLLEKMAEEKQAIEARILQSIEALVLPYLHRLKMSSLNVEQMASLTVAESNLQDIISPTTNRLIVLYSKLTPAEIEVANFIRHGKSSQQIADLLYVSIRTIDFHRLNIRKKLGLKGRANLRAHLLSAAPDY